MGRQYFPTLFSLLGPKLLLAFALVTLGSNQFCGLRPRLAMVLSRMGMTLVRG